jgi:thiamine-monophosphate kinase
MTKLNEKDIIDLFISKLKPDNTLTEFGKDDVAIFSLKDAKTKTKTSKNNIFCPISIILKCDMLVENTDVPTGMKPWQIARKSIVSCVSDLSAKGIKPPYLSLISIGIPRRYSKNEIKDLIIGFQTASKEFGIKIVGGDTNESNELIIDCNMLGFSDINAAARIPRRSGAKPGDLVVVSGEFGYSSSGLKILIEDAKSHGIFKKNAILAVVKPKPQQKFGIALAKYFSSSIDSSDGLATSLYELARQSKVNILIENIPLAKGVVDFAQNNHLDAKELIFHGGEEYEIVATIPKSKLNRIKTVARKSKLKLLVIGKVEKGDGKVFLTNGNETWEEASLLDDRGYVHLIGKSQ